MLASAPGQSKQKDLNMVPEDNQLSSRIWNETSITRRVTDGYVNATAMCKANGKRWRDYSITERAREYIRALSNAVTAETHCSAAVARNPVTELVQPVQGGQPELQGTWIHPRLAVDLARWISPDFAVWVDGWLLDELAGGRVSQVRETQPATPALSPGETLSLIERSYDMLERFGVADERDRLQFGDMVRNVAARGAGGLLLPPSKDEEELTLSDAWLEVTGWRLPKSKYSKIGKLVASEYREKFGEEPPTRNQYVDGGVRSVKSYRRGWLIATVKSIHAANLIED